MTARSARIRSSASNALNCRLLNRGILGFLLGIQNKSHALQRWHLSLRVVLERECVEGSGRPQLEAPSPPAMYEQRVHQSKWGSTGGTAPSGASR